VAALRPWRLKTIEWDEGREKRAIGVSGEAVALVIGIAVLLALVL
jgi:hypothetical protein